MHELARYHSIVHAEHAAAYLRGHEVPAMVVGHMDTLGGVSPDLQPRGQYSLMIGDRADAELAMTLLEELAWELEQSSHDPDSPDDADEPAAPPVDLSHLNDTHAPNCPRCGFDLPLDPGCAACPACGLSVDIVELLVHRHGPEILDQA